MGQMHLFLTWQLYVKFKIMSKIILPEDLPDELTYFLRIRHPLYKIHIILYY